LYRTIKSIASTQTCGDRLPPRPSLHNPKNKNRKNLATCFRGKRKFAQNNCVSIAFGDFKIKKNLFMNIPLPKEEGLHLLFKSGKEIMRTYTYKCKLWCTPK
jgi:hypothetical protein